MSAIGSTTGTSQIWQQFVTKSDTDSSGTLGVSELAELIGGDDSTSEASSIIDEFDSDGDGALSAEELNSAVGGSNLSGDFLSLQEMPPPPPPPSDESASSDDESVEDLFETLDTDGDGSISLDELQDAFGTSESSDDSTDETSESDNAQTLMDLLQDVMSDEQSASFDTEMGPPPPPPPPPSDSETSESDDDTTSATSSTSTDDTTDQSSSAADMFMARMIEQLYQSSSQSYSNQIGVNVSI